VTALLDKLTIDLKKKNLKTQERDAILEQLKVYGRSVDGSDPIFAISGIQTLSQCAFDTSSTTTSREALRCLANALLLRPETRQILVDLGCAPKAAEKLKTDNSDDEFLLSRILFLTTYGTTANFQELTTKNKLADSINNCLARHAKRYVKGARRLSATSPMDDMALTETAKLVFNITHFFPDLTPSFSNSIPSLLSIVRKAKITRPPLQQPLQACINSLINLDLVDKPSCGFSHTSLFPKSDPNGNAEHIVNILDACITSYKESELDQLASPVITLIRKIYKQAPDQVKKHIETLLLPTDAERAKPLGKSDALSSRLLRLSTSAITPTLRTSIQAMLFELSNENANEFVTNVGYGFASGFLISQNIPVPQNATDASAEGDEMRINPITGQRLDAETHIDEGPPMTDEEKEIEAEKLFVLFERLRATGVVDVVNPVRQAVEEGRFEELPDDHEEG
jgi:hypothetical protein